MDESPVLDVVASADGNATLLVWVAAGCSGCHDWTEMIATARMKATTPICASSASTATRLSRTLTKSSTGTARPTPAPRPPALLLPSDGDTVVNADTGEATTVDLVDAFEARPPTLQVLDGEGHLVWTSKTYWSNTSVLDEAATLMRSLNEAVA